MATEDDRDISDGYRRKSFEEHFRPVKNESKYSDLIQKDTPEPVHERREEKPKKGKNIVELLTGADDISEFARKLNLDPEMAEKMLIPLLSLLDKYGVGESLSASPKMESATNAFEIIRDVAPVVKGAAEFISGRKAELEATDLAFLEQIKEAQNIADATLFDDDDEEELFSVGETVEIEEVVSSPPLPPQTDFSRFGEKEWGDFFLEASGAGKSEEYYLDNELTDSLTQQLKAVNSWAAEQSIELREEMRKKETSQELSLDLGADLNLADTFAEGMVTDFAIIDVASLAAESGLSVNDVMEGDSQRKINRESQEEWVAEPIDVSEFVPADEPIVDYADLEVPEEAEDYDPLHIQDFDNPNFDLYEIEEVENLQEEENKSRNDDTED